MGRTLNEFPNAARGDVDVALNGYIQVFYFFTNSTNARLTQIDGALIIIVSRSMNTPFNRRGIESTREAVQRMYRSRQTP